MYFISILLVTVYTSTLVAASTTLGNSSSNGKEKEFISRRKRNVYADQYDDENGETEGLVNEGLTSELEDLNSQDTRTSMGPAMRNFNNFQSKNRRHSRKNNQQRKSRQEKFNRRSMSSQPGANVNNNINMNLNENPRFPKNKKPLLTNETLQPRISEENYGLVYPPSKKGNNQIPKNVIITLLIAHQLRENLLNIFGCLLQRPMDFLTEPQYSALFGLFIELRNRPSSIHSILKKLESVPKSNLNDQLKSMMKIFAQVLPSHIACSANFWVKEIEHKRIDFNNLPGNTCPKKFNILQKVNLLDLKLTTMMDPVDAPTRMVENVWSKIFVKVLHDIQEQKIILSQAMFGIILSNFPLIPYDPVLNEYIDFILRVTKKGLIPSWENVEQKKIPAEPYQFMRTVIGHILVIHEVPRSIKEALAYIRIHLKPVLITHVNPDFQIMKKVNARKLDIELLFSFIVPGAYSKETICLKNRFLVYIQNHRLPQSWMLSEMDRLRYINPHDLLLAYLAKLQRHIPNQNEELGKIVTALLSVLIVDKHTKEFAPVSKNIEILTILGILANPNFGPRVNSIYNQLIHFLISKPDLQVAINKLIPIWEEKCLVIEDCLEEVLENLKQENLEIPRQMEKIIIELDELIPLKSFDSECRIVTVSEGVFNKTRNSRISSGYEIGPGFVLDPAGHSIGENYSKQNSMGKNPIGNNQMVKAVMLPPMLRVTQQLLIYINDKGVPVVDNPNTEIDGFYQGNPKVTLPSVVSALMPPEINDPFGSMNQDFKERILQLLVKISGSSDLTSILGTSLRNYITSGKCPNLAALLVNLLERAKSDPRVQANQQLLIDIKTYLSGLDLLAVIVLPVVLRVARINPINGVLFPVISLSEPHKSSISIDAPENIPEGYLGFVIVDPNKLKEPVDPQNPFNGLLPEVGPDVPGGKYIQELKTIFTRNKIRKLLPNFKPEEYTSKGFLLMVILQKLPKVPEIAGNIHLKKIILGYISAIMIPAFFTRVSYPEVIAELGKQPRVEPDTAILTQLLPQPQNEKENSFFLEIQALLERQDLFEILLIPKPTTNTNQNELLKTIINAVINSAEKFDLVTVNACKFYNTKIFDVEKGSLPLMWEMKDYKVTTFKVRLGDLIENVIQYEKLSDEDKRAYNDLLSYLRDNSVIFTLMKDFPFKQYKTNGTFVRGFFKFLLETQIIPQSAKKNIKAISQHVMVKGPGAEPLEMTERREGEGGRRSASQLEIDI